ncbi:hypothetical protein BMS3Bbin04_02089 [bacterium BMS3Bbin04]|nr:hypothetical protein BMS3Bbin04_02089 [bacterium BMS3Bbin04]
MCSYCPFVIKGLHQDRKVFTTRAYAVDQTNSSLRILLTFTIVFDVGYHTQHVLPVPEIRFPGFLIVSTEENLRACTHAQNLVREVHALPQQRLALLHQLTINHWQIGGIEADVILNQENGLYAHHLGIMISI